MRDLAIVGGGPVGMALTLAACARGLDAVVLEARAPSDRSDPRLFALSYGSRLILERLNAWTTLTPAHPIRKVHVSQRGGFGTTVLEAEALELPALGYVVAQRDLMHALSLALSRHGVARMFGARVTDIRDDREAASVHYEYDGGPAHLSARVVAQADGRVSGTGPTRARDYGQRAIVAEVRLQRIASETAYERFTPEGPIALLPLGDRHGLIWTVSERTADAILALDDASFELRLAQAVGERFGEPSVLSARVAFPLVMRFATALTRRRVVLVGNAAQTLHPVAGQGFNLGLRDAFELAQELGLARERGRDLTAGLERYRARRRFDRVGASIFTDTLVRLFTSGDPLLTAARGLGLSALDACPQAKNFLMRRMIFGAPT